MLNIEQLRLIMFCMKNQDILIEQSLQNPNRQLVQSCIPNLEIYFVINTIANNTDTIIQLYMVMKKQAQNYRAIIGIHIDSLALVSGQ